VPACCCEQGSVETDFIGHFVPSWVDHYVARPLCRSLTLLISTAQSAKCLVYVSGC